MRQTERIVQNIIKIIDLRKKNLEDITKSRIFAKRIYKKNRL